MIGSYEGDFGVQCKNATSQGLKDISKRTFSITRIGSSDSITITSTNNFLVKAKLTTGSNFVLKQADLFGEIHTGSGAVTDNKLTFNFNADATVAYGYSCVKDFSGVKKAQ